LVSTKYSLVSLRYLVVSSINRFDCHITFLEVLTLVIVLLYIQISM
jgi:hypothetical protein